MQRLVAFLYIVLFAFLFLIALSFFLFNSTDIELNYYVDSAQMSLSIALLCAFVFGAAVGVVGLSGWAFKLKREISRLNRVLRSSERDLQHARTLSEKS